MFLSMKLSRLLFVIFLSFGVISCQTTSQTSSTPKDFRKGPDGGVDLIWTENTTLSNEDLYRSLRAYNKILLDPIILSL